MNLQRDLPDVIIAVVIIFGVTTLCLVEKPDASIVIRTTEEERSITHWAPADVLATTEGVPQDDDGSMCYRVIGDEPAFVRDAFQRGGCSAALVEAETLHAADVPPAVAYVRVRRDGPLPVRVGIRNGVLIASFAEAPPRSRYRETREFLKAFKDSLQEQE